MGSVRCTLMCTYVCLFCFLSFFSFLLALQSGCCASSLDHAAGSTDMFVVVPKRRCRLNCHGLGLHSCQTCLKGDRTTGARHTTVV